MNAERAAVHLAEPKSTADLIERFPSCIYDAGTDLFRSHRVGLGAWWFSSNGGGRFDLPAPDGTCYLAEDEVVTLLEIFGGQQIVPSYEVDARTASTITLGSRVVLADLTSNTSAAFGVTSEIFTIADYPLTQRWAISLRAAGFQGLRYWARHDLEHARRCVALFDAAGVPDSPYRHTVKATASLRDRTDLLERWHLETGVTVSEIPDL